MNLSDAASALADIATEVRAVADLPIPPQCLDITLHMVDGSSVDLTVDKPLHRASERMHRLCRWLSTRRGNRVDYIETFGMGVRTQYVVPRVRRYARMERAA